ncbi:MAG: hypothetical protein VW080_03955, partial [Flavobacteriaceae bacterium]
FLIFLILIVLLYFGLNFFTKSNSLSLEGKYLHPIGHIDPKNAVIIDSTEIYESRHLIGFYSSAAPSIYTGCKYDFKTFIKDSFQNKGYSDNGYLNIRFYLNSQEKVFMYEVNELNLDLEPSNLDDKLVDQLLSLSLKGKNWHAYDHEHERSNYYMYLNYRIENGAITAIIP